MTPRHDPRALHGLDHCPYRCRWCGPEADAWALGEAVVGLLAAVATVATLMVRHPAAVAFAVVVLGVGGTALGAW
jgi:hypothetical protein